MTPQLRKFLNYIDKYMATAPEDDAKEAWDVLSALRGPDDSDISKKDATTALIRFTALPKTMAAKSDIHIVRQDGSKYVRASGALFAPDSVQRADARASIVAKPLWQRKIPHFDTHVSKAFQALGLKWGENNTKE